jgi:hypothetical protein
MDIFSKIDRSMPIIVAEAVWQYSHHILAGLISHEGPILTLANWSGKWPGMDRKPKQMWLIPLSGVVFISRLHA